ncbi:hypothetical protein H4R18_000910 [Coemansia javaensis]|uniref:FAS1 domain-containing protein n=1 Tax=Coemansia javaensis TaxID=2761396 RepID=A0A9W8HJQ3_9FUNG|nr:hypothetical protein H4R18_000910 [Coemansia javaensis]
MASQYTFDSGAQGPPALSDVIGQEKSASIAIDAILRSEALVRALSGDSADFASGGGLTLLLPTNRAFQRLDELPADLEQAMARHFVPQALTRAQMAQGAVVSSYRGLAQLRFSAAADGRIYVQADGGGAPVEVRGAGTHASTGVLFLVDALL